MDPSDFRARLFGIIPPAATASYVDTFQRALEGGDFACLLLPPGIDVDLARAFVSASQNADCAVLVTDDTQLMGRVGADGVHLSAPSRLEDGAITKHQQEGRIVGTGGPFTRHSALETAERAFDYLFFGRTDRAPEDDTHPKVLKLATWWAEVMTVPCVAVAGTSPSSFTELAEKGVEFIAMGVQIWDSDAPDDSVRSLNQTLDDIAHKRMADAA